MLWESTVPGVSDAPGLEIHRMKGLLRFTDGSIKMAQGVREVFELVDAPKENEGSIHGDEGGKIILIGRNLNRIPWDTSISKQLS